MPRIRYASAMVIFFRYFGNYPTSFDSSFGLRSDCGVDTSQFMPIGVSEASVGLAWLVT